jgi:hypothetical protein
MGVAQNRPMSLAEFLEWEEPQTIRRDVVLEQDELAATGFAREGERWVATLLKGDALLAMPEIGIDVPLSELYEGLDFPVVE